MKNDQWFILVRDDSGHQYVIPEEKKTDWDDWLNDEECYTYGQLPNYAIRIDGYLRFKQWGW